LDASQETARGARSSNGSGGRDASGERVFGAVGAVNGSMAAMVQCSVVSALQDLKPGFFFLWRLF